MMWKVLEKKIHIKKQINIKITAKIQKQET